MNSLKFIKTLVCVLMLVCTNIYAEESPKPVTSDDVVTEEDSGGFLWGTVMYIPNRIFDALDIVRARVRVGPGISLSARLTKLLNATIGTHMTLYAGSPGPRNKPAINLPVGLDNYTGVEASVVNLSNDNNSPFSPSYGTGECGAGFQFLLFGVDIGVDPLEAGDFVLGFFTIDLKDDDF